MRKKRHKTRRLELGNWQFYRLSLKDKTMYSKYIKKTTAYIPNVFPASFDLLWASSGRMYGHVLWKVIDGMLVLFRLNRKRTLQLAFLPVGPGTLELIVKVLYKCSVFCHNWNRTRKKRAIVRVVNHTQLALLHQSELFKQKFEPVKLVGVDRHVSVQKLLELKGKDFENVRVSFNRFRRENPDVVIRRGNVGDGKELVNLKQEWNRTMGNKYAKIHDEGIYRKIIKYQEKLEHTILIAESKGQIIGMYSGGILPHGQAWASLHKRKEGYYGLSEFLYIEFAREIHNLDPQVETINLGIDVGVGSGLSDFKNKFRPVLNEERYALYLT